MAYHTTIFKDARKDYSIRHISTQLTYGSVTGDGETPYSSLPVDPSPAFEDSVPTPPPDSPWFAINCGEEEDEQKAAEAAWSARQRELYMTPGVGRMITGLRGWNGRRIVEPPPGFLGGTITVVAPVLATVVSAFRAELVRGRFAGRTQLAFWLDRGYYHLLQRWRPVAIELHFIIGHIKSLSLAIFSAWTLVIVVLKAAVMLGIDPSPGEVEYFFVNECRSWSVAAY
ncbi:hypothetical protein F5B21DRAFT_235972 [Xylaria acuta]|nr:hypothetical protein F5B21DRAFT_235972 [Xylaria acuta]